MSRCLRFPSLRVVLLPLVFAVLPAASHAQVGSSARDVSDLITVDIPVRGGWNLISNPVVTSTDTLLSLFPTSLFAYGFLFSPAGYVQSRVLHRGAGMWGRFASAGTVRITGEPVTVDTFEVLAGWNLVGSISYPVPSAAILSNPPGIIVSPFYYHDSSFVKADTIRPGFGYYVKIASSGEILVSVTGGEGR